MLFSSETRASSFASQRGASLIRNRPALEGLEGVLGGWAFSYGRGTPVGLHARERTEAILGSIRNTRTFNQQSIRNNLMTTFSSAWDWSTEGGPLVKP